MNFSLDQLLAFVTAAQAGSFSAAARELGKAQSVVSTAISNLEIDLGLTLFSREQRSPTLTEQGERLLPEARLILERCDYLSDLGLAMGKGLEAKLTLVVDDIVSTGWLSDLLKEFASLYPEIEFELLFAKMDDVVDMVHSGRAHLGITERLDNAPLTLGFRGAGSVHVVAAASNQHPLAHKSQVSALDLKQYRQILVTDKQAGAGRNRARIASDIWWTESHFGVLDMIQANIGWGFIPEHLVQHPLALGEVSTLAIDFDQEIVIQLDLLWTQKQSLGPAGQWLRQQLGSMGNPGT
ncbi:LysR family transcriptional regulator [Dongshaea marina]|uniref:LysR family transcriptional regulator n=1 Tax=Dongshaea marina TaxID=2047966 RepID=UPI000D3E5038|nr:LysR family transcriptional regulator [Dongshaea marina]